jgi:hypothetical protein
VLIEKLLYSCSELREIIVLMRPKRGKTGAQRVDEFSKIPVSYALNDFKTSSNIQMLKKCRCSNASWMRNLK